MDAASRAFGAGEAALHYNAGVFNALCGDRETGRAQLDRVQGLLERLPAYTRVETGGTAPGPGFQLTPTVVSGLRQDDELVQEEVFAPVVTVQPFTDETEALEMANGVPYGLASSVWTNDVARVPRLSRAARTSRRTPSPSTPA